MGNLSQIVGKYVSHSYYAFVDDTYFQQNAHIEYDIIEEVRIEKQKEIYQREGNFKATGGSFSPENIFNDSDFKWELINWN